MAMEMGDGCHAQPFRGIDSGSSLTSSTSPSSPYSTECGVFSPSTTTSPGDLTVDSCPASLCDTPSNHSSDTTPSNIQLLLAQLQLNQLQPHFQATPMHQFQVLQQWLGQVGMGTEQGFSHCQLPVEHHQPNSSYSSGVFMPQPLITDPPLNTLLLSPQLSTIATSGTLSFNEMEAGRNYIEGLRRGSGSML